MGARWDERPVGGETDHHPADGSLPGAVEDGGVRPGYQPEGELDLSRPPVGGSATSPRVILPSAIFIPPCPDRIHLARLYARIPLPLQAVPVEVAEVKGGKAWAALGAKPRWSGITVPVRPGLNRVNLRVGAWEDATFYHELTHAFTGQNSGRVTPEQWNSWLSFWHDRSHGMPTPYATTDPSEGLAECGVEVLAGHAMPGYHALSAVVRTKVRGMLGLAP